MSEVCRTRRRPSPPRGGVLWAPDGHVSWLEAAGARLPGTRVGPSGTSESAFRKKPGPLTVAGPRRIHTGFREPPRPILSCPEDAPAAPAGQLPGLPFDAPLIGAIDA